MSERFTGAEYAARLAFVTGASNPLTSCAADSPVRTSASPAAAKDSPVNEAGSGSSLLDSFAAMSEPAIEVVENTITLKMPAIAYAQILRELEFCMSMAGRGARPNAEPLWRALVTAGGGKPVVEEVR